MLFDIYLFCILVVKKDYKNSYYVVFGMIDQIMEANSLREAER